MAEDIAANDSGITRRYNALIEENFGLTYIDAVDNEHLKSRSANQSFRKDGFDPEAIAERARNA